MVAGQRRIIFGLALQFLRPVKHGIFITFFRRLRKNLPVIRQIFHIIRPAYRVKSCQVIVDHKLRHNRKAPGRQHQLPDSLFSYEYAEYNHKIAGKECPACPYGGLLHRRFVHKMIAEKQEYNAHSTRCKHLPQL